MVLISKKLWQSYMPDTTMPDGCTYQQFTEQREKVWLDKDIKTQYEIVESLKKLTPKTPQMDDFIEMEESKLIELYRKKTKIEMGLDYAGR